MEKQTKKNRQKEKEKEKATKFSHSKFSSPSPYFVRVRFPVKIINLQGKVLNKKKNYVLCPPLEAFFQMNSNF